MVQKQWILRKLDQARVNSLKEALGKTNETVCSILVARGLDTYDKVKQFVNPELSQLHDPWLMKDMDKAVRRLNAAKERREKILFFGDYDVDGTTAVAMMMRFFSRHYDASKIDYYIPDRYQEGYGLSDRGIRYAAEAGVQLLVSLDCGITGLAQIEQASEWGIDVIVCDHHLPGECLPTAAAILNPKQADCGYPFKELCGTGVAFKLLMALSKLWGLQASSYLDHLDLVALATGADVVPITCQNRILAHLGLQKINTDPCPGIKALKELNADQNSYSLTRVIFDMAPKINAAGRMDHGKIAVQLLITDDAEEARRIAAILHRHNQERKQADKAVTLQAIELLKERDAERRSKSLVVFQEQWHKGVLGIVASRLIDRFYRPTIVLTMAGEHISGSARSIGGFNMYEAVRDCSEHLIRFGGHVAAAGLTLPRENLASFAEKFESVVAKRLSGDQATPKIYIDGQLEFANIDWPFFNTLRRLEPFGHQNEEPVFLTRRVIAHRDSKIVGDGHVRFIFDAGNNRYLTGFAFGQGKQFEAADPSLPIDIVYSIQENEWNQQKSLQLRIIDFKTVS